MNSIFRHAVIVLATVSAFAAVGCQKRPLVDDPGRSARLGDDSGTFTPPVDVFIQDRDPTVDARKGRRGILPNVYFAFDSAAISAAERAKMAGVVDYLNTNPNARLLLEGHCDWRGTADYNLGLGDRRADAVRQYLATLGIPATRLETLSLGDQFAKEGGSAADMQEDRRVELAVLD